MGQAHFLDGSSQVIAFEIDRRSSSSSSSSLNGNGLFGDELKKPFALHPAFWVDRYLLQNRHSIAILRDEISRIEGEADVSLARRNQLAMAGVCSTISIPYPICFCFQPVPETMIYYPG
jgi:hypothetical protein